MMHGQQNIKFHTSFYTQTHKEFSIHGKLKRQKLFDITGRIWEDNIKENHKEAGLHFVYWI
jgi:hypothetical protein